MQVSVKGNQTENLVLCSIIALSRKLEIPTFLVDLNEKQHRDMESCTDQGKILASWL